MTGSNSKRLPLLKQQQQVNMAPKMHSLYKNLHCCAFLHPSTREIFIIPPILRLTPYCQSTLRLWPPTLRRCPQPASTTSYSIFRSFSTPSYRPVGRLEGKKAIITGASRGIGAAIAERFAAEGASCVLVGRDKERLKTIRCRLRQDEGVEHKVVLGDVGEGGFWAGLKSEKPVDILVNAAGVAHYSPLFTTSTELLERVVKTNLMGTMLGCKAIGRTMMSNYQGGCIINVASLLGLKGGKGSAGYAASKAGVIGLTRAFAAETGKFNIRVNVIVPGYIETDMTAAMTPQARSESIDAIPLKRFGEASDVADAAMFLATNTYANNCVLNLDGGLSAV